DGAGAGENVPVCFARQPGKGGGYGKHLGTRLGIGTIERGKTQIVADRQADDAAETRRQDRPAPRRDGGALAIFLAVAKVDVEEMKLVVAGDDAAPWINHERAIERAPVFSLHADRADKEPCRNVAGGGAQRSDGRMVVLREGYWI